MNHFNSFILSVQLVGEHGVFHPHEALRKLTPCELSTTHWVLRSIPLGNDILQGNVIARRALARLRSILVSTRRSLT